jgi:hypothetical protein
MRVLLQYSQLATNSRLSKPFPEILLPLIPFDNIFNCRTSSPFRKIHIIIIFALWYRDLAYTTSLRCLLRTSLSSSSAAAELYSIILKIR